MNRSLLLACFALFVAMYAFGSVAQAQASRTWVSGVGDDANPCSRTAPCKTFAGAISKTAAGGEIDALDPGGFGTVTITKAITIDGGGGQVASTLAAGTHGIVITAAATDVVTIKNLRMNGLVQTTSPALDGIHVTSAGQVNVENCMISDFGGSGISFAPNTAANLNVTSTTIDGNFGGGIVVQGTANATASIDSSEILNNTNPAGGTGPGIEAAAGTKVSVSNTTVSGNQAGVIVAGGGTQMMIFQSNVVNNHGNGVNAIQNGNAALAFTSVSLNHYAGLASNTGGTIQSFGNNYFFGNGLGAGTFNGPGISPMIQIRRPPGR